MAKTITINGTDYSSATLLDSLTLVESAYRGEVGIGGMVIDDPSASLTIPALKACTVDESAAATARMFTGYTQKRNIRRGTHRVSSAREWNVEVLDANTLLDDFVLGDGESADRPAETDTARVAWLLTTRLNSLGGVTSGVVSGTAVDLDASDYRGMSPRDVLEDCAEKSHKNFFIYRFGSGPLLYYDKHTNTNLSSSARISTVNSDVDNSTTWAAIVEPEGMTLDPDRVYSTVRLRYKRGVIRKTDAGTVAAFRTREKGLTNTRVKSSTRANEVAEKYLESADTEKTTISMSVRLPAANVNDIRAGQRIQVKAPYMGIAAFTYKRITRRIVSPAMGQGGSPSDQWYHVRLEFWDDVKPTRYNNGGPHDYEENSNATEDDATVIIDRSGINITDGAITVINGNNVVIIDGSSDILQVVASGTVTVPRNTDRGDVKRSVWVPTGLTFDPMTLWSIKRPGEDGNWSQTLPLVVHNTAGQVLEYYGGRARYQRKGVGGTMRDGTDVQAIKGSTRPPLDSRVFRYRILKQSAL